MLTVKQIHLSGLETIRLAKQVEYEPNGRVTPGQREVWVTLPNGDGEVLAGGTVFVMNDLGKTVTRYDMGASQVPLFEEDGRRTAKYGEAGGCGNPNVAPKLDRSRLPDVYVGQGMVGSGI